MSGFFGFDTALPERRDAGNRPGFGGFQDSNTNDTFSLAGNGAGEEEDLAVYTWGDTGLLEGGDDMNDETFGDVGDIGQDFQFSSQPQTKPATQPRGPIASTASRYKPKAAVDPFAFNEDDFYSSRPATKKPIKSTKPKPAPTLRTGSSGTKTGSTPGWGTAPGIAASAPSAGFASSSGPPPPSQMLTLEEIEAEMSKTNIAPPPGPKVLTLAEIEAQMLAEPPRQATPQEPPAEASGYANPQALLDSMFPELRKAPADTKTAQFLSDGAPPGPTPEQMAQMEALHQRITIKIASMSKYNNLMGSSDKDFITRIQLSQLATSDPYTSDFYAQVYSALMRSRMPDGPAVVEVTPGVAISVGAPIGNRFGKMGTSTMQKLSTQVKKLVESRVQRNMSNNALQGALGKVMRTNAAAPRPVLAVPTRDGRTINQLNQQTGPKRQALTRKQVMFALEELYDDVLDVEQMRRNAPPPTAIEEIEAWNVACQNRVEGIWRRLMVMEPLDVSNPHPFISLLNPIKGQKLFPRLLRHLPQQQALTLLTLLIATYPQLDVVARAPPPPVADASLLTKADRMDRAKREADTDNFLHCVIPGVDALINRCHLGLVAGLLGICAQRMEIWKVASTRPGVAIFTALLSKAQSVIRSPPDPSGQQQTPDPAEVEQWTKTYGYFLQVLLPHLPELFPSTQAQKAAFGPGAYLLGGDGTGAAQGSEKEGMEMERREAEVWGFAAALAVNAPEEEQTNLVGALRETILHTVQAARSPLTPPARAEMKLRNVNMFLNGLGLDAAMIDP